MFRFSRSPFLAALLLFCMQFPAHGEDAKAPAIDPGLAAADQLFRAGKFAEAETSYQALVKSDPKLVPAQTGLVRTMLRLQRLDEALDAVNAALVAQPDSAALLAAKGDVQFRRAEMSDAELSYLAAKKLNPKEVHAYLGLARLYRAYSMYHISYGELQIAHQIAPDDIDVQRAWLGMLPRKERLAAFEAYLAGSHPDDEEETKRMTDYLEFLKATVNKPVHECRLVSKVEQTETNLEGIYGENGHRRAGRRRAGGVNASGSGPPRGLGLSAKLNDVEVHLLLDTGAGGIVLSRKIAEDAGLTRISTVRYGGIGDKGMQNGYMAVADHIRIGELEFQDCVVAVGDMRSVTDDGLIGADVFGDYLVDIDLPGKRLKLSPLPKRPEDAVAPTSLISEGEELANAERKGEKEGSATESSGKSSSNSSSNSDSNRKEQKTAANAQSLPRDRYIAPEMANWTKVFRFGHALLVPTSVNDSKPMLFGLDTGAFSNILSLRAARQVAKVSSDYRDRVNGLSGPVSQVYSSAKVTLSFGHFRQSNQSLITFDLSGVSSQTGTEVSGFLGFEMLRKLELKLDYRDGLVDFVNDRKHAQP
ncbi:MAG: aspartyl protease family protein [Terriglobales bacterium]|jgi:tetratricopeptide (TPR) repeat protein